MASEKRLLNRSTWLGAIVSVLAVYPAVSQAAPGPLAQVPLYLSANVQPNIFLVIDDSGSMDWEVLKRLGAEGAHPDNGSFRNRDTIATFTAPSSDEQKLELCPGYNALAYNPSVTYTPWAGQDSAGNDYENLTLTTARSNPYNTATTNISSHLYFVWTDSDGDGDYDLNECPLPTGTIDSSNCGSTVGCQLVSALSPAGQQNYANWWSYYRKRDFAMKRAVSEVVSLSSSRMGLATLWDRGTVATEIDDMRVQANKDALLRNVFRIDPGSTTPLRRALEEAGQYFDDTDNLAHDDLSTADSPILPAEDGGACQQNFAIVFSDGFWNGGDTSIGNEDNDTAGAISSEWDGGSHQDAVGNTLADVAMYYYERDLSALPDQVRPIPDVDENEQQHLVTFTVAFGVTGTLADNPPNRDDAFTWPDPTDTEDAERIDDMRHAAWNGRGQFLSAQNPPTVAQSLNAAISSIEQRNSTASAVGFNTTRLSSETLLFQAQFNSNRWSGNLLAFALDPQTGNLLPDRVWSTGPDPEDLGAGPLLDARTVGSDTDDRVILTRGDTDGVPFEWDSLSTEQQEDLRTNPSGTLDDVTTGQRRLRYLRGFRGDEGANGLRVRNSRLGDIVSSSPVFVGGPALGWPDADPFGVDGDRYSDFKNGTAATRTPMVYVGANDGMLHGFRADRGNGQSGRELFAYIPSNLFSTDANEGLHRLTDPGYTHRYYVDREPAVSDVYIRTSTSGSQAWRTVAIGGQGAGGRGLYALDITDPSLFSEAATNAAQIVMWEFSDADDAELGYTFSEPVIAMMNDGRWAAILSSGYNDAGVDPQAHLFIVFLEGGLDGTWTEGTDYIKIATNEPTALAGDPNGLSAPAVADLDGDGDADRVYAGDLFGNLWVFDVSAANTGSWDVAYKQGGNSRPLFTTAANQPITIKPEISLHPTQPITPQNEPNVMVYFGTGQYLTDADKTSTDTQSFYGVWDSGTRSLDRSNLQEQTFEPGFVDDAVVTDNPVNWDNQYGWYIDLPVSGERVVVNANLRGGVVFFNTLVPTNNPCDSGGTGFQVVIDMETGGRPDFAAFDFNNDAVIDDSDLVSSDTLEDVPPSRERFESGAPTESTFLGNREYTGGSDGTLEIRDVVPPGGLDTGRLSWQELRRD